MTIRLIGALLCGASFVFMTTGVFAENLTTQQALVGVNKKASRSNTTTRKSSKTAAPAEPAGFWYIPGTDTCKSAGMVTRGNSCVERGRAKLKSTKDAVKPGDEEVANRGKTSAEHLKVLQ
jgi:hypothetical protein